jgi:hypothetical protein
MMSSEHTAILGLYFLVLPVWIALSIWTFRRSNEWTFTPKWHRRMVPALRVSFLATLPFEALLAERTFIPVLFVIGAAATMFWIGWRIRYLSHAPTTLPREDSVNYNIAYIINLMAFALALHSFVCVVIMANLSLFLLMIRLRYDRLAESC